MATAAMKEADVRPVAWVAALTAWVGLVSHGSCPHPRRLLTQRQRDRDRERRRRRHPPPPPRVEHACPALGAPPRRVELAGPPRPRRGARRQSGAAMAVWLPPSRRPPVAPTTRPRGTAAECKRVRGRRDGGGGRRLPSVTDRV